MAKLKDYETSKKDMKRGSEIVPEENYRLRNEDLFPNDSSVKIENFGTKAPKDK
jgi:hypothetical protein